VSEAVTRAAIDRKESRGAQFRDDYPEKSEECSKFNIVLRRSEGGGGAGEMQLVRQPTRTVPPELQQVIDDNK